MSPQIVIVVLAILVTLFVGREVGKWMFGKSEVLEAEKRAALVLSSKLREYGLKILPELLEDFAVGDVSKMIAKIQDVSKLVEAGNEAILKELEATFDKVLTAKLMSPEGLALIKAKLAEVEKVATPLAEAAISATVSAAIKS